MIVNQIYCLIKEFENVRYQTFVSEIPENVIFIDLLDRLFNFDVKNSDFSIYETRVEYSYHIY